jgi:hypothetical protein
MRRLNLDSLQRKDDRIYHNHVLFDGIAYEVVDDRVIANSRVIAGLRGGPAEEWEPARLRVLVQALYPVSMEETDEQFPDEGAYLDGARFDGISYAFDQRTGILRAEEDHHPTNPGPSREWYSSGMPQAEYRRPRPDGKTESECWHENGTTSRVWSIHWGYGATPEGRLRTLNLEPGTSAADLGRVPFAADAFLSLAGTGITDDVVSRIADTANIQDLSLSRTGLSPGGLGQFRTAVGLKKLTTRNNVGFSEADVRNLLAHLPVCLWDPCRLCPKCGSPTYSGTAWFPDEPGDNGIGRLKCPGCGYEEYPVRFL